MRWQWGGGAPTRTPRWQVLFVVVDVGASNDHVLQYFGLKAEEAPTLRFINIETTKKYMPADRGPVTTTSVAAFCHAVLGGEVKVCCWTAQLGGGSGSSGSWERPPNKAPGRFSQPYRLSQEVPPNWDQRPVKTLVGKNFEQVAFDETKNVFIKFCECRGQWASGQQGPCWLC